MKSFYNILSVCQNELLSDNNITRDVKCSLFIILDLSPSNETTYT